MRLLCLFLAALPLAFGQGQAVSQVDDPPPTGVVQLLFYDGSNNLQYVCYARQDQQRSTAQTYTNVVVSGGVGTVTATAHKLWVGARVTLAGSATTALNGTYSVLTAADANTYTISTAAANATYTDATITTTSPLTSAAQWAIKKLVYNGSNYLTNVFWQASSTGYGLACDNRATN